MVFSTLHTNDSPSAFTRLIDMGLEPFLVASTVEGVMARRLVRTVCPECKVSSEPDPDAVPSDFPKPKPGEKLLLWKGTGCRACRQNGFRGRTGIYELMVTGDTIRELCVQRVSAGVIRKQASGRHAHPAAGWLAQVLLGQTIDEVARVTAGDIIA
jgi:general secretion pathway protein E/type IV pilus assembly protein PilB